MDNIQVFFMILSFYDDGKDGITGITYDSLFQVKFGHTTTFKASAIRPSSKPCLVKSNYLLDVDTKGPRVYSVKLGVSKSCSMPRTMFLFVFASRTDWGWRIEYSQGVDFWADGLHQKLMGWLLIFHFDGPRMCGQNDAKRWCKVWKMVVVQDL